MSVHYNKDQTVQLWLHPQVDVIQVSSPQMTTLDRLALQAGEGQHDWEPDATALEITPIFAGRACYQSFGEKAGRKTAADYLGHIKEVGHFSVIEHSYVSFYIQGVSRTFTHEAIRHRMASYSQLSQRFVPYDKCLPLVIHPNVRIKLDDFENVALEYFAYGEEVLKTYRFMLDKYYREFGNETFAQKKKARETAREYLPNMVETKLVWTMNLRGWLEMLSKRNAEGADGQIHKVASMIEERLIGLAPNIFGD